MNSIDDFARLRPSTDDPTSDDLDHLWQRALSELTRSVDVAIDPDGVESTPLHLGHETSRRVESDRRRRFAVLGAAASLVVGVAAIAVFAGVDDAEAPGAGEVSSAPLATTTPPVEAVPQPGVTTTAVGETVPPTARELEAAALTVELGLDSWELVAAESVETGNEYHYRPAAGSNAVGVIDIVLVPGREAEYLQRVDAATDVVTVDALDATTQVASIGIDRYRYTAVLSGFDLDWIIEIDAGPFADRDDFNSVISAVSVRHADGRVVDAISEVASGARVTIPPLPNDATMLAIGDSILLGAASQLNDAGIIVDASVSRAFVDGLDLVGTLVDEGTIGGTTTTIDTVIIHLGSNGPINPQDLDLMMELLSPVRAVVVTNGIDRDYTAANNDLIRSLPSSHPNVTVLDWAQLRTGCPGDCFEADDVHLKPAGRKFDADLLSETR